VKLFIAREMLIPVRLLQAVLTAVKLKPVDALTVPQSVFILKPVTCRRLSRILIDSSSFPSFDSRKKSLDDGDETVRDSGQCNVKALEVTSKQKPKNKRYDDIMTTVYP